MRKDILASSRKRKRKKMLLKTVIFLFFLILVFVAGSFFLNFSYFKIKKIAVKTDLSILDVDTISARLSDYLNEKYLYIFPLNNIFLFSAEKAEENLLKDILRIKEIEINKNLPDEISVNIKERNSIALFCRENKCGFLDETGLFFENAPFFSGSFFVKFLEERAGEKIKLGEKILKDDLFNNLIRFKNYAQKEGIKINEIKIKDEGIYNIFTSNGWYMILDEENKADETFENLKILKEKIGDKEKDLDYINLCSGNKVFYKFK